MPYRTLDQADLAGKRVLVRIDHNIELDPTGKLKNDKKMSIQEKVKLYNDCNRKVAILCNHKRTVGASHEAQMEKMSETVSLQHRFLKSKVLMSSS